MRAMRLEDGESLAARELPVPRPEPNQVLIKVAACGVCRTDLHVVDGELKGGKSPIIPGHEIVGVIEEIGADVADLSPGQRVGVPWLGWTCGRCEYCNSGRENLCDRARFTGFHLDGGYAEYAVADARYCFPLPAGLDDLRSAPLLCAGLIGYRALAKAGAAQRIGIYGFGAAAHILAQLILYQGRQFYGFTRPGDADGQAFARALGASWVGSSIQLPPELLDAAIIFAPVGDLVPQALRALKKGGRVICAGIHMSDIPRFPYGILWGEREIVSVANLTRADGTAFLAAAADARIVPEVEVLPLASANEALARLKRGDVRGAFVLQM